MSRQPFRIHVELLDGRAFDVKTTTLFAQADQYELERRFGISALELDKLSGFFGDDGKLRSDVEFGAFRQEHIGFLLFRAFAREEPAFSQTSFDDFRAQVDVITFESAEAEPDPTKAAPLA